MKTINTIDDAIKMLREPIPYMEPDEDLMQTAEWLEELKTLRVEHEKNSKELEVYKKALGLACNTLGNYDCCDAESNGCIHDCETHITEHFLQKAREQG